MQKSKTKIAVICNGKLSKALVKGLILSGYSVHNIIIIVRGDSKSDFSFFTGKGIRVSNNMQEVASAQHIVITTSPGGSGDILKRLNSVLFDRGRHYEIISLTSELSRGDIRKLVGILNCRVIRATCNTNIAYGKGLICATEMSFLFSGLGDVIIETPNWILRSIVTVGSGNGFDCKALLIGYQNSGTVKTLHGWLAGLRTFLSGFDLSSPGIVPAEYSLVVKYLVNKSKIFSNEQFRYSRDLAKARSMSTMRSTLGALIEIGDDIKVDDIVTLMDTVVTPRGCTEKGINLLSSVEALISLEILSEAFLLVWEKAKTFKKDVKESIKIKMAA